MSLAIVSRPVVTHTVVGDVDTDSWVVKVEIKLLAKWEDGQATATRLFQLTTPRAIEGFDKDESNTWPIDEQEGRKDE